MLMKRGSAKQIAEERQRRAATRRKIFLKPNGWILIKTILAMVITSTSRASQGRGGDAKSRPIQRLAVRQSPS
jgi:hypothetical protein